jgi:AbrB family looped-hinge helix DNA binding protein
MSKDSTLDEKGRIIIPASIRSQMNLKPGEKLFFQVLNNEIIIKTEISPEKFINDAEKLRASIKKIKKEPIEFIKLFDE